MEEQLPSDIQPPVGSTSPFMSYEDMYQSVKRPESSFEEFWEQKRLTSSGSELGEELGRINNPKSPSLLKTPSFMTNSKMSLPRLSSLSKLPRLSSLRLSDLGEQDSADGLTRESRARTFSRRLIPSFSFGSTSYRTASESLERL
jgi:hypothetical protein